MLLRRFYDAPLAQASYLVGCQATGEALVVDPNRDVAHYLAAAHEEGVRITHVTETHIHADFMSGARELVAHTGARLLLSGEGGPDWQYRYAAADGATLLHDGDTFTVGNLKFEVVHTPGHTPEHLTFIVTDTPATDRPMGAFTGDFLFVGDVGRPDLLERAAKVAGTMESAARTLFRSLQRFASRPDYLQIWPGHGAGSACGKALGAVPQSTLGYERVVNWAFGTQDEGEFVRAVLAGQPEPPAYFAVMKRSNRDGPAVLGTVAAPPALPAAAIRTALERGDVVIDLRATADFAAGHIPGTMNLPFNKSFTTWAGSLLPYDRELYLIGLDSPARTTHAVRALSMIGLDHVAGVFPPASVAEWERTGELERVRQVEPSALDLDAPGVTVVDVRGRAEWEAGHLPGVRNIPLATLGEHLDELPSDGTVVLQCQGGGRSSIATAMLLAHGHKNVANLRGGYRAWHAAGLPVELEDEEVKA